MALRLVILQHSGVHAGHPRPDLVLVRWMHSLHDSLDPKVKSSWIGRVHGRQYPDLVFVRWIYPHYHFSIDPKMESSLIGKARERLPHSIPQSNLNEFCWSFASVTLSRLRELLCYPLYDQIENEWHEVQKCNHSRWWFLGQFYGASQSHCKVQRSAELSSSEKPKAFAVFAMTHQSARGQRTKEDQNKQTWCAWTKQKTEEGRDYFSNLVIIFIRQQWTTLTRDNNEESNTWHRFFSFIFFSIVDFCGAVIFFLLLMVAVNNNLLHNKLALNIGAADRRLEYSQTLPEKDGQFSYAYICCRLYHNFLNGVQPQHHRGGSDYFFDIIYYTIWLPTCAVLQVRIWPRISRKQGILRKLRLL